MQVAWRHGDIESITETEEKPRIGKQERKSWQLNVIERSGDGIEINVTVILETVLGNCTCRTNVYGKQKEHGDWHYVTSLA